MSEVDRINLIIMQLSTAEIDMVSALRNSLVDSLKISSYETHPDNRILTQRVSRKIIDTTFRNIQKAQESESKSLLFSLKLARLNMT